MCGQGLTLPWVFPSLLAPSHQAREKEASNVAFVLLWCCSGELSCPTSVNHPWLPCRLWLPSRSRLRATITCSSLLR